VSYKYRAVSTDHVLHIAALPHNQWIITEVWRFSSPLSVEPKKTEVVPDEREESVKIELQLAADDHTVRQSRQPVHFLQTHSVHLVVTLGGKGISLLALFVLWVKGSIQP
jgi:hypothetical protein